MSREIFNFGDFLNYLLIFLKFQLKFEWKFWIGNWAHFTKDGVIFSLHMYKFLFQKIKFHFSPKLIKIKVIYMEVWPKFSFKNTQILTIFPYFVVVLRAVCLQFYAKLKFGGTWWVFLRDILHKIVNRPLWGLLQKGEILLKFKCF